MCSCTYVLKRVFVNVCTVYIMQVITCPILLSNNRGQQGGMFHVKHKRLFENGYGLYQFHPIKKSQTQPSKMAQPSHSQPITPPTILLLLTLIKHHLFVINLSTTTNSYLSTLNINFLLYITKFILSQPFFYLLIIMFNAGRGGINNPKCVKSIECYIEQTL